ncbi:unnamed protein product [Ceratitis capitata]|uniref:(Mediterranean fruit fly) hypothetical protein n=1 Tax=Ceratitis capitata TaxID=7213 RepID=A0A811V4I2_CERCA|nr:unnamed protein product [Ceratitis capitata]
MVTLFVLIQLALPVCQLYNTTTATQHPMYSAVNMELNHMTAHFLLRKFQRAVRGGRARATTADMQLEATRVVALPPVVSNNKYNTKVLIQKGKVATKEQKKA